MSTTQTADEAARNHQGRKFDQDKDRWDLLPWLAAREVVKVLTWGARKYDPDNWRHVPEPKRRYFAATMRHLWAWVHGEIQDRESGFHHLAHALCCVMFLLEPELEQMEEERKAGEDV